MFLKPPPKAEKYLVSKPELTDLDYRNMGEFSKVPHIETVLKLGHRDIAEMNQQLLNTEDFEEHKKLKAGIDKLSSFLFSLAPPDTKEPTDF